MGRASQAARSARGPWHPTSPEGHAEIDDLCRRGAGSETGRRDKHTRCYPLPNETPAATAMGSCVRTHATAKVGTVRFTGVPLQAWTASVMRLYGLLSIVQKARSAKFSDIYVMIVDTCYKLSVLSCS